MQFPNPNRNPNPNPDPVFSYIDDHMHSVLGRNAYHLGHLEEALKRVRVRIRIRVRVRIRMSL